MKKIMLSMVFMTVILLGSNANTIGVLGRFYQPGFSATASFGKVEADLGITELSSGALSISADYNLFNSGIANDFYWNFGFGAGLDISSSGVFVSVISPIELTYNIDEILNGIDIYLQAKPIVPLNPSPSFDFEMGLGVRVFY